MYYNTNSSTATASDWASYNHAVSANQQVRIIKKQHDSRTIVLLDANKNIIGEEGSSGVDDNGWRRYDITVPNNPAIKFIGFNLYKPTLGSNNYNGTVMIFDNHDFMPTDFVSNIDDGSILIDGNQVKMSFNPNGTDLTSNLVNAAIKELDKKKADKVPYTGLKVFDKDKNEWNAVYFRIPALLRTKNGNLLSTADVRYKTAKDQSFIDIGSYRSEDDGLTWSSKIAMENNRVNLNLSRVMDSTMLQTRSGKIILLAGGWDRNSGNWEQSNSIPDPDWNPYIVTSTDDGETWTNKVSIKDASKCRNQPQGTVAWLGGVGTGIEMENGTLIFPIQIRYFQTVNNGVGSNKVTKAGLIYSTDDGETWTMSSEFVNGTENMIVEVNGSLIMSARNGTNRAAYITKNLGATWSEYEPLHNKISNRRYGCQGSFIAFNTKSGHRVGLISTPKNLKNSYVRDNITIYMIDFDDTSKGIIELFVPYPFDGNTEGAGYSSLAYGKSKDGRTKLDIVYEDNGNISYKDITFLLDEIEKIVTNVKWGLLDYATEIEDPIFTNIYSLNTTHKFDDGAFNLDGTLGNVNRGWGRVVFPVEYGKIYRVTNINGDQATSVSQITGSSICVEFNTDNNTFDNTTRVASGRGKFGDDEIYGRKYMNYRPTNQDVTHMSFNINLNDLNSKLELMVWESSENPPELYVPEIVFSHSVALNGEKVKINYDSIQGLNSTSVKEALEELVVKSENEHSDLASLSKNNVFTATNVFDKLMLIDGAIRTNNYTGNNHFNIGTNTYIGDRNITSSMFEGGYVDKIRIRIGRDDKVESVQESIGVLAVTKGNNLDRSDDRDIRVIVEPADYEVQNMDKAEERYIEIPIKQIFREDTYFLIYSTVGNKNRFRSTEVTGQNVEERFVRIASNVTGGIPTTIPSANASNHAMLIVIYGGLNVKTELNKKISTINNQTPISCNIDLSIEKTNESINFKVGNQQFGIIEYMTEAEVQAIKDLFV